MSINQSSVGRESVRGVIPVALGCELVQSAPVELVSSLAPFSHTRLRSEHTRQQL